MGWTEGYPEIFFDVFSELIGLSFRPYPTLAKSLLVTRSLLKSNVHSWTKFSSGAQPATCCSVASISSKKSGGFPVRSESLPLVAIC